MYMLNIFLCRLLCRPTCRDFLVTLGFFSLVTHMLLICSGSVESNPGPHSSVRNQVSFCCWNIDSLLARDGAKVSIIEALQTVHNFDLLGFVSLIL